MVSIIGRDARVIQAHMCPIKHRLKVRYSQLLDFADCKQKQMDLFVRWLLNNPVSGPIPPCDKPESNFSPVGGDPAPWLTAFEAGGRCNEAMRNFSSAWMSMRPTVMIA